MFNRTGCEVTLKTNTRLADVQVYGTQPMDLSDESGSAQLLTVANVLSDSDSSNVSPHPLQSHVTVVDYREGKDTLLDLISSYRRVLALPGEHLGITNKAFHQINLQPGSQPICVPSYRLPHSQRIQVEEMVPDVLDQKLIEESTSTWNAPLFLVTKQTVLGVGIDFRRLSNITIPEPYSLPVLNDLFQSIGSGNNIFKS